MTNAVHLQSTVLTEDAAIIELSGVHPMEYFLV